MCHDLYTEKSLPRKNSKMLELDKKLKIVKILKNPKILVPDMYYLCGKKQFEDTNPKILDFDKKKG